MQYAGFWKRLLAYLIDAVPISLAVGAVFYVWFGFDEALQDRIAYPDNMDLRMEFMKQRNVIRAISFFCWLLYCLIMESTPLQGTLGKKAVGIKVTNTNGFRPSFSQVLLRTLTKIVSYVVLGLGFIWVAFSKQKQGWHDSAAKTLVVGRSSVPKVGITLKVPSGR